ncbi:MAG: hypothetical protein PF569_01315 [Candidatus Woesearchaeota archaeon]|jgi:ElaB/YqjD/DUF883 family membrane-anchored ribosome-binding protein|nr:hypothetical protein [Candidatus Woesearchaeota archaeon]
MEENVKKKDGFDGSKELSHPSFGSVSLSKITCGNKAMFRSSIKHDNYISLKIKQSHLCRSHSEDNHSSVGEQTIVEIALSPLQFSEMLTTMNYGEGVPCTIEHRIDYDNCNYIKYPDEMAHKDKLQEFLDETGDVSKDLQRFIKPHLEKVSSNLDLNKTLSKTAQKELLKDLQTVMDHLGSNSKFFMKQFTKYMESTVVEAKATIDSHVDAVVRQTGLEAIKANKMLIEEIK